MPIDGGLRDKLVTGTVLVAKYKGSEHRCEVVAGEDGQRRFRLEDGREFRSPSSAGSAVMWASHVKLGTDAGVPGATIETIVADGDLDGLQPEGAAIVRYVRELLGATHRVSDATFEAARAELGDQGVVDLTGLLGYYAIVGYTLNAFEVAPPDGSPALPPR